MEGDKMRKTVSLLIFVLFISAALPVGAQTISGPADKVAWHGYTQFWMNTDFNRGYNLALRRLKFWLGSGPAFSDHWSFKVQALFTSLGHEKFFLQDVYGQYRNKSGVSSVRFGQFTPRYSLQRTQHDYLIAPIERAMVINASIPGSGLGVRDIGLQYNLKAYNGKIEVNAGVFNGYGIKTYRLGNTGFMLTHNFTYTIKRPHALWKLGYSVMYRKAVDLLLKTILPDTVLFTGNDFRFDVYALFRNQKLDLQAEFSKTYLNGSQAYGYYALATVYLNPKNELYFSFDHFKDLNPATSDHPWYVAGYNYLFKKHDLMLTLDTRFRNDGGKVKNLTSMQFQMFFH